MFYPSDLPSDEPSMIARAQDILVTLSGPQMQLEQTRVCVVTHFPGDAMC